MNPLELVSPIDGRYRKKTKILSTFFSEKALNSYRIKVECEYLLFLSQHPDIDTRNFSDKEKNILSNLHNISKQDAQIIHKIECHGYNHIKKTNHDVKAIEYFIKEKLKKTTLSDNVEWVHFGLTSEDINNISYGLMVSDCLEQVIIPILNEVSNLLENIAQKYTNIPMLARTHGQPASPTTVGKEFKVFSSRIKRQINQLKHHKILVKLNGATGNYNASHITYPNIDFITFTKKFIKQINKSRSKKVDINLITTQVEPNDSYAELFDNVKRINTIFIDFNQDIWRYISDGWIKQKKIQGEVGSSTMPHKINPIDFENSEGNLGIANALLTFFSLKLPISRLQRDLSDSTVKRNYGVAFSHCLIAYHSIKKGLNKIEINQEKITQDLLNHPEVIAEAIQTILRKENLPMPYEQLMKLTQGKDITINDFNIFINQLNININIKNKLKKILPDNYIGITKKLIKL